MDKLNNSKKLTKPTKYKKSFTFEIFKNFSENVLVEDIGNSKKK